MNDTIHYVDDDQLKHHIRKYHQSNAFSSYLQEIVYGGSDGIVSMLAVISGFAGANIANTTLATAVVLIFGLANLFADASSMGLGNFLGIRSERAVWNRQRTKQIYQLHADQTKARESLEFLLLRKGYSRSQVKILAELIQSNEDHWVQFTLQEELGIGDSVNENSYLSSLFTFLSFITFGGLPLIPYFFETFQYQFYTSLGLALLSLTILGFIRQYGTKETLLRSVGETVLVGGVSSLIAFIVGVLVG